VDRSTWYTTLNNPLPSHLLFIMTLYLMRTARFLSHRARLYCVSRKNGTLWVARKRHVSTTL